MFPSYFEFYNPVKILCGEHALENIAYELKRLGASRPLLITSQSPTRNGLCKIATGSLKAVLYDTVPRDSSFQTVEELARLYHQRGCDSILAIGGGSVLDTAKGLRILISQNAEHLENFMGVERIPAGKHIPFVMVPTTAGTGSECTKVAVIADTKSHIKHEFLSDSILPDVAVIDPRSTLTLPPKLTASTGIDTLVHAIEAYTCLQKNPLSDAYAMSAVSLVGRYLIKAVNNSSNPSYRVAMSGAALMAGIAFSSSMVGLCHAIGHACTAVGKIPHGEAMAVLLPSVMRFNLEPLGDLYGELLFALAGAEVYAEIQNRLRPQKMVTEVEALLAYLHQSCDLPITLRQTGILLEDFQMIAKLAVNDGAIILNPKPAGVYEIEKLLEIAF